MDLFNIGSVIGFSIAGIIWIGLTWRLIANRGWAKGLAISVGSTLGIAVATIAGLFIFGFTASEFGDKGFNGLLLAVLILCLLPSEQK